MTKIFAASDVRMCTNFYPTAHWDSFISSKKALGKNLNLEI
jgi:hypothetical protein